ncbi:ureidoglycolate lyase [Humitalea sp. 24SJ18S-53]|uniref:ureidoglycolate lyase n=1 Tax=Humitalea sp. 24SJ18S-53 TaxID=3422307 RepID=UPI003D67B4FD
MSDPAPRTIDMIPQTATTAGIAPFGTLILPGEDGAPFGDADAQLALGAGTPRFYIMRLAHRPMGVVGITRHVKVTQVLASADGQPWFICLAPPGDATQPDPASIACFRIPPGVGLALHRGTWHAGPYFQAAQADFFNLELSDTNIDDHHTVRLDQVFGLRLRIAA